MKFIPNFNYKLNNFVAYGNIASWARSSFASCAPTKNQICFTENSNELSLSLIKAR